MIWTEPMTKEENEDALDFIQSRLEDSITNYALMKTEDLLDEEENQIVRAFFWEQGTREYILTLTPAARIRMIHTKKFPHNLIQQICNELVSLTHESWIHSDP
jgi:hypothetical protein